jgi:eukaryotic-like serine/threonine-protein kinase
MEMLEGETLQKRIERKRFDLDALLDVTMQVAEGLEAAHNKGIVHRDIKPSNIFVTSANEVKILDFGLSKLAADGTSIAVRSSGPTVTAASVRVTTPGQTMGTVAYMSPEQVRGEELDPRTDIFSCGVVLYEMATSTLPFPGATTGIIFSGILNRAPTPASAFNPAIPVEVNRILDKALVSSGPISRVSDVTVARPDRTRLSRPLRPLRRRAGADGPWSPGPFSASSGLPSPVTSRGQGVLRRRRICRARSVA